MTDDTTNAQDVTSGSVADIKDHLDTVQTPEELAALKQAEEDGKARPTALAAIDAKADELGSGDPIDTATDEQIDTIAGTDQSHETSNEDAKATLEKQRDEAQGNESDGEPDPADPGTVFHGQGGAFGL